MTNVDQFAKDHGMVNALHPQSWNQFQWEKIFEGGPSILLWSRLGDNIHLQLYDSEDSDHAVEIAQAPEFSVLEPVFNSLETLLSGLYKPAQPVEAA